MFSHSEVIGRFSNRVENGNTGEVEFKGKNVFCKGNFLYSYGTHFPLAIYRGKRNGKHFFLKNGDSYSISTSKHQSMTQRSCKGPTVSFQALREAGLDPESVVITDYRKDTRESIFRDKETGKFYEKDVKGDLENFEKPKQGVFVEQDWKSAPEGLTGGVWHILGAVLLNGLYLGSLDENHYFMAELPEDACTVKQAFETLKPKPVQNAEAQGLKVKRQGEWFFVKTNTTLKDLKRATGQDITDLREDLKQQPLEPETRGSNHETRVLNTEMGKFCTGKVYHRNSLGKSTGEHTSLDLSDGFYKPYKNCAINSWTINGRLD